jgi:hypothetical protein
MWVHQIAVSWVVSSLSKVCIKADNHMHTGGTLCQPVMNDKGYIQNIPDDFSSGFVAEKQMGHCLWR